MTPAEVEAHLRRSGALLEGHFLLTSGRHSGQYVEKFRLLEDPSIAVPLCALIAAKHRAARPTVVLGAVTGGVILAFEVARQLGTGIRAIFAERIEGKLSLRRGFALGPADRAVVVDDILTTGGSMRELFDVARDRGAPVVGASVLVDRRPDEDPALPVQALLRLTIASYDPADCPICHAGTPLVKPGSRTLPAA